MSIKDSLSLAGALALGARTMQEGGAMRPFYMGPFISSPCVHLFLYGSVYSCAVRPFIYSYTVAGALALGARTMQEGGAMRDWTREQVRTELKREALRVTERLYRFLNMLLFILTIQIASPWHLNNIPHS